MTKVHSQTWMATIHKPTYWTCDICQNEVRNFEQKDEFQRHLREAHRGSYSSDSEFDSIVETGENARDREPHVCPICNAIPQGILDDEDCPTTSSGVSNGMAQQTSESRQQMILILHIEGHLRFLAQMSTDIKISQNLESAAEDEERDMESVDLSSSNVAQEPRHLSDFGSEDWEMSSAYAEENEMEQNISGHQNTEDQSTPAEHLEDWNNVWEDVRPQRLLPTEDSRTHIRTFQSQMSDDIMNSFISSAFHSGGVFLPCDAIEGIVTKQSVLQTFGDGVIGQKTQSSEGFSQGTAESDDDLESDDDFAERIVRESRTVFAIMAMLDLPGNLLRDGMRLFDRLDISDENLPLDERTWRKKWIQPDKIAREKFDTGRNTVWTTARYNTFCDMQWQFLAPVFSSKKRYHILGPQSVLPFTQRGAVQNVGSFGQVTQYEIHPSHIVDLTNQVRSSRWSIMKSANCPTQL